MSDIISILANEPEGVIPLWIFQKYPQLRHVDPTFNSSEKFSIRTYEIPQEDTIIRIYVPLKRERELCNV